MFTPPLWFITFSPYTLKALSLTYVVERPVCFNAAICLKFIWHTLRHLGHVEYSIKQSDDTFHKLWGVYIGDKDIDNE